VLWKNLPKSGKSSSSMSGTGWKTKEEHAMAALPFGAQFLKRPFKQSMLLLLFTSSRFKVGVMEKLRYVNPMCSDMFAEYIYSRLEFELGDLECLSRDIDAATSVGKSLIGLLSILGSIVSNYLVQ
jgi:hypothetical protein